MVYVLDTNIVSEFFKNHARILARVNAVPVEDRVATTTITRFEILRGRYESIRTAADREQLLLAHERLVADERRMDKMIVLPITAGAGDEFVNLLAGKKLKKFGRADLLIACITLAHGATLVSRNTKDFASVPGLKTENWAD